jgi:phenylacetate-CoA ligase
MHTQVEKGVGIQALDMYGLSEVMGPGVAIECTQEAQSSAGTMRRLYMH